MGIPVLRIRGEDGEMHPVPAIRGEPGKDGKSAYQTAQDGGYTGTEAEFAKKLADPAYFITTYTDNGDGTASGEHTFEETGKAFQEGKILMANVDGVLLPMVYMDAEILEYAATIAFEGIFASYDIQHNTYNSVAFLNSETTVPAVDAELSDTSENPVQGKTIKAFVEGKGYQTEAQVTALIDSRIAQELGTIEAQLAAILGD